jgi:hypothetical protein
MPTGLPQDGVWRRVQGCNARVHDSAVACSLGPRWSLSHKFGVHRPAEDRDCMTRRFKDAASRSPGWALARTCLARSAFKASLVSPSMAWPSFSVKPSSSSSTMICKKDKSSELNTEVFKAHAFGLSVSFWTTTTSRLGDVLRRTLGNRPQGHRHRRSTLASFAGCVRVDETVRD